MRILRKFHCADCGKWTERKRHSGAPLICMECGIARGQRAAREMAEHSGEHWDRFTMNPGAARGGRAH